MTNEGLAKLAEQYYAFLVENEEKLGSEPRWNGDKEAFCISSNDARIAFIKHCGIEKPLGRQIPGISYEHPNDWGSEVSYAIELAEKLLLKSERLTGNDYSFWITKSLNKRIAERWQRDVEHAQWPGLESNE